MRLNHFIVLLASTTVLACGEAPTPPSAKTPATPSHLRYVNEAVQGRTHHGFETAILALQKDLPELGGIYVSPDGKLQVYLTDTAASGAADIVRNWLKTQTILPNVSTEIRLRPGRHRFSELVEWRDLIASRVHQPQIHGIDADEANNTVTLWVQPGASLDVIRMAVTRLGVPEDAIRIIEAASPQFLNLRDRFPNGLGGGMQIQNNQGWTGTCTLAFNVKMEPTMVEGFLTASHCETGAKGSGGTGSAIYQNVFNSAYQVGTVSLNPAWNVSDPACGSANYCTWSDAMFVLHNNSNLSVKVVARTASVGTNYQLGSIFENAWRVNVQKTSAAYVGLVVDKVGRTTGWTRGTVDNTCMIVDVVESGVTYRNLCQDRVGGSTFGPGDSGSPVFIPGSTTTYAYGILSSGVWTSTTSSSDGNSWCTAGCYYYYSAIPEIEIYHLANSFRFY